MVEIEHIQDIEKDQPAKSSAKEQKLKDPKDLTTETQDTDASEATEHDEQIENQEDNTYEEQFQLLGGFVTILYGTINLRILDNLWRREPAQQK